MEHLIHHVADHSLVQFSGLSITLHLVLLWTAAAGVIAATLTAARMRAAGQSTLLAGAMEGLVVAIRDGILIPAMGEKQARKHQNFFLTIGTLILASNLLGLAPLGGAATGNFFINAAFASLVFVYGIVSCSREHGFLTYLKSFAPPGVPGVLIPMMWTIEFGGMILKHCILAVRLTANIVAGHLVLAAILMLVGVIAENVQSTAAAIGLSSLPVLLAVMIYLLECLVAVIQAAVFTILASIFFGMAVNPHH